MAKINRTQPYVPQKKFTAGKHTDRKQGVQKKVYHANGNQKLSRVAILSRLKSKTRKRYKEGCYIFIR